jgi:Protein of unknown function (DUF3295)
MDVPRQRPSQKEVPALSSSVESAGSDEHPEQETCSGLSPLSDDSALSRSRGKEKHLTSFGLEKMFVQIKEQTQIEPLSPVVAASCSPNSDETPRPLSPSPHQNEAISAEPTLLNNSSDSCYSAATVGSSFHSDHRGSDTSVSSGTLIKSGSIVHGFSPSPFSTSLRARISPDAATPVPRESTVQHDLCKKKTGGMFTLGGSSGDDESSFEDRMAKQSKRSSLSERLKQSETGSRPGSFRAAISSREIRTIQENQEEDEGAIESDDEEMDESAIEEEEDSEWEDSPTESGKSSVHEEKPVFKRVDSRANLVSRKSLLTRGLHEPQRAAALAEAAMKSSFALRRSRTSSPSGPSLPASPSNNDDLGGVKSGAGIPRSKPIICTTSNTHVPAHSPRTTRRNMLATELTESLRRHLLWERQQKSITANAVYKRRHTAHTEMAKLHEFPGPKIVLPLKEVSKNNSWNNYFDYNLW